MTAGSGDWCVPGTGAALDEDSALARLAAGRVALLGERHDRAADHEWQASVLAALAARRPGIAVGFEMFPREAQPALDAFAAGDLDEAAFLREARWPEVWGFDPALYAPIFRLCRARRLPMLALNCARPLVRLVGEAGWQALPPETAAWLTPARAATPAYRRYLFGVTGGARPGRKATAPEDSTFDGFVRAQQVWDRAFACSIAEALAERPDALIVALIGRGHLEYGHGTPFQLAELDIANVITALPLAPGEDPPSDPFDPVADLLCRLPAP